MKYSKVIAATLAVFLLGILLARYGQAFSIREMLGLEDSNEAVAAETAETAPAGPKGTDWGKPSKTGTDGALDLLQVQMVVANLPANQRQALLADAPTFQRFVQQEADNVSVLSAARANNADQDATTAFLMQRSADNILRESYLNRLVAGKVPADFPTEAQTREYYEKNKDKLVIGERYHVWQIFFPITNPKDEKAIAALQKQADTVATELSSGKVEFAAAAARYSAHDPSRHNGGYMGLLAVSELKPEISKPLLALDEGAVSKPLRSENGIHILKRGGKVAAQPLGFDEAKTQIRQALITQARNQLRKAIFDQARASYPVALPETKVEEWRLRLRTNLPVATPTQQKADAQKKP